MKETGMSKKQATRTAQWYENPLNSRIREQMKEKKITPTVLAGKLDLTVEAVRQWCGGYSRPDVDNICKIADIFGVSVDFIIGRTNFPNPNINAQGINERMGLSLEAQKKLGEIYTHAPHLITIFNGLCTDDLQTVLNEIHRFREVQNVISEISAQTDDTQTVVPELDVDIAGYKKTETGDLVQDVSLEAQIGHFSTKLEKAFDIGSLIDLSALLSIAVQKSCCDWIDSVL
jgi:transcriptional regulator with XRE-family HTH domain